MMVKRRVYEVVGLACGFALIDYAFNIIAVGLQGARELTSQFVGVNLLLGGAAVVFVSLYYLLKPAGPLAVSIPVKQTTAASPDVGVELVVEERSPPQVGFYRTIEYLGYGLTALGLFSAADLILQVFIPSIYNEARWWTEVLLVTFGVLAYTIFGSVGRVGMQEEAKLATQVSMPLTETPQPLATTQQEAKPAAPSIPAVLQLRLSEFTRSSTGDYERQVSGNVFDMCRVERGVVSVWREERQGIRSVYLAGPYELKRELLEGYSARGEELRIGHLSMPVDVIKELLSMQAQAEGLVPHS